MEVIMCRSCGHFQSAVRLGDDLEPLRRECEECGGETFRDGRSDDGNRADA